MTYLHVYNLCISIRCQQKTMFWWPPGPMPQVMNDITNLCGGGDNTLATTKRWGRVCFGEWVEWVSNLETEACQIAYPLTPSQTHSSGRGKSSFFNRKSAMHAGRSIIGRPLQQFAPPETEQCALENILYHCNLRIFQAYCF